MTKPANFKILEVTNESILIRDIGPWNIHFTITNDPESVIARLWPHLDHRRLLYFDSDGELTEILVKDGQFAGYRPAILFSPTPIADAKQFAGMSKMTIDERTPAQQKIRPHCPECKSTIEQMGLFKNDSPIALIFCPQCGCVLGLAPQEAMEKIGASNG